MKRKEEIVTSIALPLTPTKRVDAAAKAEQLLTAGMPGQGGRDAEKAGLPKITGRVFPEHIAWVKDAVRGYSRRHPRRPKLTVDLLVRLALDHLKDAKDFDAVITRYLN
jgi:hypothetical protein